MATKKAASVGGNGSNRALQPGPGKAPARRRKPSRAKQPGTLAAAGRSRASRRRTPMQPGRPVTASEPLEAFLRQRVIGQDDAIDALVRSWTRLLSGLRDPDRPLLTALLLGPTGVGKTETAKALAEALFSTPAALTRINCEEYSHGHEVAKLLGSPPGYVGSDIEPLLSQHRLDRAHWQARQARKDNPEASKPLIEQVHDPEEGLHSILLFDDVEKAHPTLWNALLGILEDGAVTLGNNKTSNLTRSVILMTSNVGSREMSAALARNPMGFMDLGDDEPARLGDIARNAATSVFPAEFINRFDEILTYEPLETAHLERIFDKFLGEVSARAMEHAGLPLLIKVTDRARASVLEEGTDPTMGARPLRRSIERLIVDPLSRLIASTQVVSGDVVEIDWNGGELVYYRLPRAAKKLVA